MYEENDLAMAIEHHVSGMSRRVLREYVMDDLWDYFVEEASDHEIKEFIQNPDYVEEEEANDDEEWIVR